MVTPSDAENDDRDKIGATKGKGEAGSGAAKRGQGDEEGEDEGGAPKEGDYSGLNDNQKPVD